MVKSETRRDAETLVSNPRPRLDCFPKSEPETLRFQNSDARHGDQLKKSGQTFFLVLSEH